MERKNDILDVIAMALVAVGLFGAAIVMVLALRSWPQPALNDANLWGEAHYRAMQAEARAMKGGRP